MDTHNEHVTLLSQLFTWIHVELSRMERVVDREEARRRRDDGVDGLER